MKKVTAWIQIILCSILLIIFAIIFFATIYSILTKRRDIQMSITDIIGSLTGFLIAVTLMIVGLKNGIEKIKKEKVFKTIQYDKVLDIKLSGQIEYQDYRNLIFGISLKKPIYFVALGIMFLFTITVLINREYFLNHFESYLFVFILVGTYLLSPVFTLIQIKKLYKTNKIFQEQLNYKLTNDSIHIKGNTVESTQSWTHFYKMKEEKNFFLFYQGKSVATLLDKKMFSESELFEFQNFIKSLNINKSI